MAKFYQIIFTCIALLSSFEGFSQSDKIYSGAFNTANIAGTASYHYVMGANGERVFTGPFRFSGTNKLTTITGAFSNNRKEGPWTYKFVNQPSTGLVVKYTVTATTTGAYLNGQLNGPWQVTKSITARAANNLYSQQLQSQMSGMSMLMGGGAVDLSNKQRTFTYTSNATFRQNQFAGNFLDVHPQDNRRLQGQFSADGYCTGTWTYNFKEGGIPFVSVSQFTRGVMTSSKTTNVSTGAVKRSYDESSLVLKILAQMPADSTSAVVDGVAYKFGDPKESSSPIAKALRGWYNDRNLVESALAFEVTQGTVAMTKFPFRTLTKDEQRTSDLANKKEQAENQARRFAEQMERRRNDSLNVARAKQSEFERTDYGRLTKDIREEYQSWTKRGEFETAEQASQRVSAGGAAEFEKIRQTKTANSKTRFLRRWEQTYASLDHYNVDRGTYTLNLESRETNYSKRSDTVSVAIPVQAAKALKEGNYVSKPLYVPVQVALVDDEWQISKAVLLFNFSPEAIICLKQLGLTEGQPTQLKGGTAEGWMIACESCSCASPIAVKSLALDYAAIPSRASQETSEMSAQPSKTGMRKTGQGGRPATTGAIASALFSAAIGSSTPIVIPGKKTAPVAAPPKALANIYWAEWNAPATQSANEAITMRSLGLAKD